MKYCPECAEALVERDAFGRARPVCPRCGYVAFRAPKVAVGAIVVRDERFVLTQRAHDPGRGLWGFPAGYMEWDERLEDAARREVLEETGLVVWLERLVGAYSYVARGLVLIVYAASVVSGELRASEESDAVAFFAPDALPALAFPENVAILADWRAGNRGPR